jgi:hypothetical protein
MLTINFPGGSRHCSGIHRRNFLQVGTLSLGGLALPQWLQCQAQGGQAGYARPEKSVVLLYLSGGASQIETFDPKMMAPDNVRSVTGEVKTSIAGVTFGGNFSKLAQLADRLAVVRSFAHSVGDHEQAHVHVLSGGSDPLGNQQRGFSIGSSYIRMRGTNHERTGLPTYITLNEREVDGQYLKEVARFNMGSWPGELGKAYAPFAHQVGWQDTGTNHPDSKDNPAKEKRNQSQPSAKEEQPAARNLQLNIEPGQLTERLQLLNAIDGFNRQLDRSGTMAALDEYSQQALSLLLGDAKQAFDLSLEDPRLVERYDTSQQLIGHKSFRPSTLGKQMLLARRLCEAGAGFVSVHSAGWDMHADNNNPGMRDGMNMLGPTLDRSVSAFLEDVEARGLSEQILLVIVGDFGRTPKIDEKGGRGHWARLCPLVFAGGGLKMGQIIGESNELAEEPTSDPISPADMMATVMHTLFDVGAMRLDAGVPRAISSHLERGQRIESLFG